VPSTSEVADIEKLIDHVFPALDHNMANPDYMTSRAILSTKNENVDGINMRMSAFKVRRRSTIASTVRRTIHTATTL